MRFLLIFGFIVVSASLSENLFAQDAEKKEEGSEKPEVNPESRLFPEKEFYSKEEVAALRTVLEKKSNKLEQDIETKKEYVESLNKQVEEHLAKIEEARNEIADFMNARDEKEETKLKKLARFYEAMDAEQASPLLQKVQDELAIKIFDRMDTKKAGSILAQYPPQRAARITTRFPKLKLQAEGRGDSRE